MIIYIEGVDGSGKSTLAKALYDRLKQLEKINNVKVVLDEVIPRCTLPRPGRFNISQLMSELRMKTLDTETIYICDRGPLSDIVYRTFDNHETIMDLPLLWSFWMAYSPLFTVVGCDSDKSEEFMKARGDDNPIAYARHKEIRYLYKQLLPMFAAILYNVETMGDNLTAVVNRILATVWTGAKNWAQLHTPKETAHANC